MNRSGKLKRLIRDFHMRELQKEADRLGDAGVIPDDLAREHLRTPYQ
jgi:hypothetical protein